MPASGESHCLYGRRSLGRRQRYEHERNRESRGSKRLSRQQYFGPLEARRSRALSNRRNPGAIPAQTSARDTKNTRRAARICEDRLPNPPLASLFRVFAIAKTRKRRSQPGSPTFFGFADLYGNR